ncbi:hypothetical protein CEXT_158651 [Caerostris extrusa]|uniref:Uncharacterized protein n=1 Tax=Caerostris extrusa TaxID=172846 RepID=A0AAV4UK97_CAEEX|nr:hypothetical protein CEXT_158651 [Caerostris extrusa]
MSGGRRKRRADEGDLTKRCAPHARRSSYSNTLNSSLQISTGINWVNRILGFCKEEPFSPEDHKSGIWRNGVFRITVGINGGGEGDGCCRWTTLEDVGNSPESVIEKEKMFSGAERLSPGRV